MKRSEPSAGWKDAQMENKDTMSKLAKWEICDNLRRERNVADPTETGLSCEDLVCYYDCPFHDLYEERA